MWQTYNDTMPLFQSADDFQFSNPKIEAGWFDIQLMCLKKNFKFTSSYLGEPFSGFIEICTDLHSYFEGELQADTSREFGFNCEWQGEPWIYDWSFWPRAGRKVNVRLMYHAERHVGKSGSKEQAEKWFEVCISCDSLIRQWYEVGKTLLMIRGLIGYRNEWIKSEFPLRAFRDLHEIVTAEKCKAESVEDDICFLSRFVKTAAVGPAGAP